MMTTSQIMIMRPKVTSLYLLTIAAMISVPPVLPLQLNTTPKPIPHIAAPIRQAMKSCPSPNTLGGTPSAPFTTNCRNHSKNVSIKMAYVVLMLNFGPSILIAKVISTALMMKYDHWMGNPVA